MGHGGSKPGLTGGQEPGYTWGVLRLMGLPPPSRFPDVVLVQDEGRLELRFGGAGDTRTVEIPLWTLEGQDVEAAQLWLLAELRQRGYRVTFGR
jgi:hypothetical protein